MINFDEGITVYRITQSRPSRNPGHRLLAQAHVCAWSHIATLHTCSTMHFFFGGGGPKDALFSLFWNKTSIIKRYSRVIWRTYVSLFQYREFERESHSLYECSSLYIDRCVLCSAPRHFPVTMQNYYH